MKNSLITFLRQDQQGVILIGLIMVLVIFAALGAALVSMSITSSHSQVWIGSDSRAFYLAESGFRYAQTEYKNTYDADGDGSKRDERNQKLIDWHSPDTSGDQVLFAFSDSKEKFELKIYPYFSVTTTSYSAGATSIQTKFPGEKPADLTLPATDTAIRLKIGTDPPYDASYRYDTGTERLIFSSITPALSSGISDNMDVYLIDNPASSQTFGNGGSLTLTDVSLFPEKNGVFRIEGGGGVVYGYKTKDQNSGALQDIFDVYDPDRTFSVSVDATDDIIINPFIELHAVGIVDYGSDLETRREIVYSVPLALDEKEKLEFTDTFDNLDNWETPADSGSHAIIDNALHVTATDTVDTSDTGSLIKLNWSGTSVNLNVAYGRAGHFLSYDAQVKVGFDTDATPGFGFDPSPIPKYYGAGLSFRLDDVNNNNFGLSFLRGDTSISSPSDDDIPDAIVPAVGTIIFSGGTSAINAGDTITGATSGATAVVIDAPKIFYGSWAGSDAAGTLRLKDVSDTFTAGESLQVGSSNAATVWQYEKDVNTIVLWQLTDSGASRAWTAYRLLDDRIFFFDDVESSITWSVVDGCSSCPTCTGLWNKTNQRSNSSSYAWYYGQPGATPNYDTGDQTCGSLESAEFTLDAGYCPVLTFYTWFATELQNPISYDLKYVEISTNGGTDWTTLSTIRSASSDWQQRSIDLADYAGETVKIRFRFDTRDEFYNTREGWYIDDVKIYMDFPVQESTLMARIKEAASIGFINGSRGDSIDGIKDGDLIKGAGGATATVKGAPIIASGSWTAGDAAGTMLLEKVAGTFTAAEEITVFGSDATAVVNTPILTRANYIRAYYGETGDCGTPNDDLLDNERSGNVRDGDIHWPPDDVADWAADQDYFTLVQWDAINSSVATASYVTSSDEPDAVIQSTESDLFTPTSGIFTRAELGLHTFGDGAANVYFDDFSLLTEIVSYGEFLSATQE